MSKKISIDLVLKINSLFDEKKWREIENNDVVFESLCYLSEFLTPEENDLILELIHKYNWITYNDYNVKLKNLLKQIISSQEYPIKRIYFFPVIKPEDERKNKSGNNVSYMMKSIKPGIKEASGISIVELTSFDDIAENKLSMKKNEIFVLVDDYIGSGETLNSTLIEVKKNMTIHNDNLIISSIAIQKDTIHRLKYENYQVIYDEEVLKGISQSYESPIKEKHLETMLEIEKKLISGNHFSLGYEESEALVTMLRTPDNTFPVFWHKYKKSTGIFPPFLRE